MIFFTLGGALAGLLFGICVLKNFKRMPWEGCLSKIAGAIFFVILAAAICWNVFWPGYSIYAAMDDFDDVDFDEVYGKVKDTVEEKIDDLRSNLNSTSS